MQEQNVYEAPHAPHQAPAGSGESIAEQLARWRDQVLALVADADFVNATDAWPGDVPLAAYRLRKPLPDNILRNDLRVVAFVTKRPLVVCFDCTATIHLVNVGWYVVLRDNGPYGSVRGWARAMAPAEFEALYKPIEPGKGDAT